MGKIYGKVLCTIADEQGKNQKVRITFLLVILLHLFRSLCYGSVNTTTVNLISGSNPACSGSVLTFEAANSCASTDVSYQWLINGSIVSGETSSTFTSSTLVNGDIVSCSSSFTEDINCTGSPTLSNGITVTINPSPIIGIATQASQICEGTFATINLSGLNASSTFDLTYTINGGATQNITGLNSNASGNASFNTGTLNNSNNGQQLTITGLTLTSSTPSCSVITSTSLTLNVSQLATVDAGSDLVICTGQTVSLAGIIGGSASSSTWSAGSGSFSNSGSLTSTYTPTITSGSVLLTLTTNDPAGACPAVNDQVSIQVNTRPTPTISTGPAVCQGSTGNTYTTQAGMSNYSWSVTGGTITSGGTSNSNSITITWSTPGTGTISVNYENSDGCPASVPATQNIIVNPLPTLTSVSQNISVCSGSTATMTLTGLLANTNATINYTIGSTSYTATGVASNGSGTANITTGVLSYSNNGQAFTITGITLAAANGGCSSSFSTGTTLSVKELPQLSSALNLPAICSGTTLSYTPASTTTGATYNWSRAVVTGISQAASSGTGNISETLSNTTTSPKTVVYIITSTAAGCSGTPESVTVVVNPHPSLSSTLTPTSICSGTTFNYTPTSATSGSSFNWSRTAVSGIVESASLGTGNISEVLTNNTTSTVNVTYTLTTSANGCTGTSQNVVLAVKPEAVLSSNLSPTPICSGSSFSYTATSATAGTTFSWTRAVVAGISQGSASGTSTINETLTNTTPNDVTVTYAFTLTAAGCVSPVKNIALTVKPKPTLSSTLSPAAICSGNTFTYSPTSATPSTTFTWTRATVSGISQVGSSGSGNISQVLTNTTTSAINVTWVITSTSNGCSGTPQNVVVSVKPVPTFTSTTTPTAICSGTTFSYTATSNISGTTLSWSRGLVTGISQSASSGTGNISELLTNTTPANVNVTYVYVASLNGCSSNPSNVVLTVKPKPVLSSSLTPPAICSGSMFSYTATSATSGTTFSWTKPAVTGISQPLSSGSGNVNMLLTNTTNSPINVTYNYTLTANGCSNGPQAVVVTVNPKPNVSNFNVTSASTICAGSGSIVSLNSSSLGNGTFTFTYNLIDQNTATGATSTGTISGGNGNFSTMPLFNTANNGSTTVIVTAVTNVYGCTSSISTNNVADFKVDDIPSILSDDTTYICSGTAVGKFLVTDYNNSIITWVAIANNPNVTGESLTPQSPANKKITDVLTNLTLVEQTITYSISATSTNNACIGPPFILTVIVKPAPTLTSIAAPSICSGNSFSIPLSADMTSTYEWVATNNLNITGESLTTMTSNPMSNTLVNIATNTQVVNYQVWAIATINGCRGPVQNVAVTVYPKPILSSAVTITRCNNISATYNFTSATAGTTYSWTRPVVAGLSNPASSGTSTSVTETLNNTTQADVTTTYNVTLSANGCSNPQTVAVTITPTPTLSGGNQVATVCEGNGAVINLSGLLPGITTTISYTINNGPVQTVSGVTGSAGGTASFTTVNLTGANNNQNLQITSITTTSTASTCSQPFAQNILLSVTPIVNLTSSLTPSAVCSGSVFNYTPTSSVGGVTYNWIRNTVAGISNTGTSGTGTISETLNNTTGAPINVIYSIRTTNAGCSNTPQNVTVSVNPAANVNQPVNLDACDGTAVPSTIFSGSFSGQLFSWTNSNPSIGLGSSGSGTIPSFTASCTGTTVSTITVTPSINGCQGPSKSFTISVRKPGSWIGVVSTDWFTPANWDCNIIPDKTIDVFIPATAPNMPVVDGLGAECKDLNVSAGSTFCTATINNIDIYGNWNNNGSCTHFTGTVTFKGSNSTIIGTSMNNFHHLVIDGNLTSTPGMVNVSGNWTNNGTFTHNGGTVTFNGTSIQTIGGTQITTFNNLVINTAGITLLIPTNVAGIMTLTNGEILTSMTNILTLFNTATTSIGHQGSFVQGPMKYIVANSAAGTIRNLPIGKDTAWRPAVLTVSHSNSNPVTYTAEVINRSADSLGYILPATVNDVSNVRWWQIDRESVSNFINAKVQLYYGLDDGVTDYTNLTVVKTIGPGTEWFDIGGTGTANGIGSITSGYFTTFSKFTLGNKVGGTNPLPVELVEFDAALQKEKVKLSWITASELNNDYFTIEKTRNGSDFSEVCKIKGAGNSAIYRQYEALDNEPFKGLSYYRLKQTDFDGTFKYTDLKAIRINDGEGDILVYPNPATSEGFTVQIPGAENENVKIDLFDNTGRLIIQNESTTDQSGSSMFRISSDLQLATGVYWLKASLKGTIYNTRIVIR